MEAACEANNGVTPDAFFLCAGSARPYFWVENTEEDLINGMNQAYWAQAWTAYVRTALQRLLILLSDTCDITILRRLPKD